MAEVPNTAEIPVVPETVTAAPVVAETCFERPEEADAPVVAETVVEAPKLTEAEVEALEVTETLGPPGVETKGEAQKSAETVAEPPIIEAEVVLEATKIDEK